MKRAPQRPRARSPQRKPRAPPGSHGPELCLVLHADGRKILLHKFPLAAEGVPALLAQMPRADALAAELAAAPRFALRRSDSVWEVTFGSQRDFFPNWSGTACIHWLLYHPTRSIHPLPLLAELAKEAFVQQESAALGDARATARHLASKDQLEAVLEREDADEIERREVQRELQQLEANQAALFPRTRDNARKTARSVRQAVQRTIRYLAQAKDEHGRLKPVLCALAAHLEQYLLGASQPGRISRGHLVYQPPAGVTWG
jgi:hypothetical protein